MSSDGWIEQQDHHMVLFHSIEHGELDQTIEKLTTLKRRATQIAWLQQLALRATRVHARAFPKQLISQELLLLFYRTMLNNIAVVQEHATNSIPRPLAHQP
jgi:hypothetical protein